MAVRFDANADFLRLSSGIFDYNAGYTIMAWAYPVSNPAAQITLFSVAADGSNLERLRSNSGGTTWSAQSIVGGTSVNTNGSSVSYGSWQHWALVRRDASNLDTYVNGVLDATSTQSVSGRSAAAQLDIGNTNSASAYFNGRVFAIKAWNVALTAAEIREEMRTIRPVRLANLWGWWPGRPGSGERAKDYSGNGRSLTEGGTLTDEDAGPISWGARSGKRARPPGTQYSQTVAGTLTSTGELVRRTGKGLAGTLTSTGALIKRTGKDLVGTLTSSGGLVKRTGKGLVGTLTSSGALATARVYLKALGGTLTSSGALAKRTGKGLVGTLTSSGGLAKRTGKGLGGTLTSSGALVKRTAKRMAGTLASSGTLVVSRIHVLARYVVDVLARRVRFAPGVFPWVRAVVRRVQYEAEAMALAEIAKDPDEVIDVAIDYSVLLDGDTITSSTWSVAGVTLASSSNTTTTASARISGGTLGGKHKAKNTVVTTGGQTFVRRLVFAMQEL